MDMDFRPRCRLENPKTRFMLSKTRFTRVLILFYGLVDQKMHLIPAMDACLDPLPCLILSDNFTTTLVLLKIFSWQIYWYRWNIMLITANKINQSIMVDLHGMRGPMFHWHFFLEALKIYIPRVFMIFSIWHTYTRTYLIFFGKLASLWFLQSIICTNVSSSLCLSIQLASQVVFSFPQNILELLTCAIAPCKIH